MAAAGAGRFGGGRAGEGFTGGGLERLPVFALSGGGSDERQACASRLLAELAQRGLDGLFVPGGETHHHLAQLSARCDLVLVDGGDGPEGAMVARGWAGDDLLPPLPLPPGQEGWARWVTALLEALGRGMERTPLWACVLIGGRSSRMGRPKHLIDDRGGRTWLERTVTVLRPLVDGLVLAGGGALPPALQESPRLLDLPGVSGPLSGIVAAMRWQPLVSWLVVACDMPQLSAEAVQWLLALRRPGCWGLVPRGEGDGRHEPLCAWYDFRAAQLFEELIHGGVWRLAAAASHRRIAHPTIPAAHALAWANVNTPEELARLAGASAQAGLSSLREAP